MKLATLFLLFPAATAALAAPGDTRVGTYRDFPSFASTVLGNTRAISVLLPPSYTSEPSRRYPVLYANDGQNVFNERTSFIGKEWRLDETLQEHWKQKKVPELIVVGVGNAGAKRMEEYMPGPTGDRYLRFLTLDLKPFIDARFRTKRGPRDTTILGSSMGGLISIWATLRRPDAFGSAAALSNSYQFRDPIMEAINSGRRPGRLYLDIGSTEGPAAMMGPMLEAHEEVVDALKKAGFREGINLKAVVVEGGQHNEPAWAERLPGILEWLYRP